MQKPSNPGTRSHGTPLPLMLAAMIVAGGLAGPPTAAATAGPPEAPSAEPSTFHMSWVGLKVHLGLGYPWGPANGGGELTLFHMRWTGSFFIDPVVLGGNYPLLMHVGFAFGYPVALDDEGNRALLLGLHVTWAPLLWHELPLLSGVLIEYRSELESGFDFSLGLRSQYMGGLFTAGIGF